MIPTIHVALVISFHDIVVRSNGTLTANAIRNCLNNACGAKFCFPGDPWCLGARERCQTAFPSCAFGAEEFSVNVDARVARMASGGDRQKELLQRTRESHGDQGMAGRAKDVGSAIYQTFSPLDLPTFPSTASNTPQGFSLKRGTLNHVKSRFTTF